MSLYRTNDGDMLDDICVRHYGSAQGFVELVLDANPGLAERAPKLPAGLVIELLDVASRSLHKATIRLWD